MDTPATLSFSQLITFIIADMAKALRVRPKESAEKGILRAQAATQMILGLHPRDVIEVMLAGHAVMFHELLTDSIHDTLEGQIDTMRGATRVNIIALNKAFHMNVGKLGHYHRRPTEGTREAGGEIRMHQAQPGQTRATVSAPGQAAPEFVQAASARTPEAEAAPAREFIQAAPAREFVPAAPAREFVPAAPAREFVPAASAHEPGRTAPAVVLVPRDAPSRLDDGTSVLLLASAETVAACHANPAAMAALEVGDPEQFARAMGLNPPAEEDRTAFAPA